MITYSSLSAILQDYLLPTHITTLLAAARWLEEYTEVVYGVDGITVRVY